MNELKATFYLKKNETRADGTGLNTKCDMSEM